jgi:hypothetical protein
MAGVDPAGPRERRAPGWQVDAGVYDILVGRSSVDIRGRCTVTVPAC